MRRVRHWMIAASLAYTLPAVAQEMLVAPTEAYERLWNDPTLNAEIEENIATYRMSDVSITVINRKGNPRSDVTLEVEQLRSSFLFGANLFVLGQLEEPAESKYENAFTGLLNSATIPFYWAGTEPEPGHLRYEADSPFIWRRPPPDSLVAWCLEHDITPKGHPLVWHEHNPEWLPKDAEALRSLVIERMRQISERYGDVISLWDCVNEPVACQPKFALCDPDRDYIGWSFREATAIFPAGTHFMINEMPDFSHDYRGEDGHKTPYYTMIHNAIDQGAHIDGIGFQFHVMSESAWNGILEGTMYAPRELQEVYRLYGDCRAPLYISEVTIPTVGNSRRVAKTQAELVRNFYRLWFSIPEMQGITWWNFGDATMISHESKWRGGLLDLDFNPKPSYAALNELINHEWRTNLTTTTDDSGRAQFRAFHGRYRLRVTAGDQADEYEFSVKRKNRNSFTLEI